MVLIDQRAEQVCSIAFISSSASNDLSFVSRVQTEVERKLLITRREFPQLDPYSNCRVNTVPKIPKPVSYANILIRFSMGIYH